MAKTAVNAIANTANDNSNSFRPATGKGEGNIKFIRPSELAKNKVTGVLVTGIYQSAAANKFDDRKSDYLILSEDGQLVNINGGGNLGYQMAQVEVGTLVRISYNGMKEMTKGPKKGNLSHNFSVEVSD